MIMIQLNTDMFTWCCVIFHVQNRNSYYLVLLFFDSEMLVMNKSFVTVTVRFLF